jgi:hypothetical protein
MAAAMAPFTGAGRRSDQVEAAADAAGGGAVDENAVANNASAEVAGAAADVGSWSSSSVAFDCCQQRWLSAAEANSVQRFDPAGQADTIGFFVAKFVKTCSRLT